MSSKQIILLAFGFMAVLGIIGVTVALTREDQSQLSQAQTPGGGSCQVPAQVSNVQISFPYCDSNNQCSFVQAECKWDAIPTATSYQLTILEVDTNTVVKNELITGATNVVFPVTQNKTYQCDVAAINACGESGPVGTNSLLCAVDAAISQTPTPTVPQVIASPTPTLPPGITPINVTNTPVPTLPPAGATENTIMFGAAAVLLIIVGGAFFVL